MNWTDFFDKIYVINLVHRTDKLLHITEELFKYDIPFELVDGIYHENGAEGLRITVQNIFLNAIEKEYKQILIFEDDCIFHEHPKLTMDNVVQQLPEGWHILFLSGQVTNGFKRRQSPNLLQLDMCFCTHSWAISLQGMKTILAMGLEAPIDNSMTTKIQTLQQCYITFPILTTQKAGISDISGQYIDWDPFITTRYHQKLAELP